MSEDPPTALVVQAGCAKAWGDSYCTGTVSDFYYLLIDLIKAHPPNNAIDPNAYLKSVLDIMWGRAIKDNWQSVDASSGRTFQRLAINVKSIPVNIPADPDIRIILNVEDYNDRYGGKGLKVKWNELF